MTAFTNSFTCEEFDALLSDLLEGTAAEPARAMAEAHAETCARCRSLLADLVELRADAARLPSLAPSHDLWAGIAERLQPVGVNGVQVRVALRWWQRPAPLAAAAALLIAATAGVTWTVAHNTITPAAPVFAALPAAPPASEAVAAEYDGEIAKVTAYIANRPPADTATARVLADNIRIIDAAIARVRAAVDAAPADLLLSQQLARAYDMKLTTLRRVAAMSTE